MLLVKLMQQGLGILRTNRHLRDGLRGVRTQMVCSWSSRQTARDEQCLWVFSYASGVSCANKEDCRENKYKRSGMSAVT